MYRTTSSIVNDMSVKKTGRTPYPVRAHGIDEASEHESIDHVRPEPASLRNRTRHDGRGCASEDIEKEKVHHLIIISDQEEIRFAEERIAAFSEGQAKSSCPVGQCGRTAVDDVLQQNVLSVFGSDASDFQ